MKQGPNAIGRHPAVFSTEMFLRMLTPAEQFLIQKASETGYGSILGLLVRGGEPVVDPIPTIRKRVRLGQPQWVGNPASVPGDFKLRKEHQDLISALRDIRCGVVSIDIQDGLPIGLTIDETAN